MEHVELDESHVRLRLALAVAFLALGVGLIGFALMRSLTPEAGWVTIEADDSLGVSGADEFVFLYSLAESSASAEQKAVTALYSQLSRTAYELFHATESFDGVNNVYAINHHPNEALEVDGALYAAFETLERTGSRALYLGPMYSRWRGVFSCEDDGQLADYDPRLSETVAQEYLEYAAWAGDPEAISLELLGDNMVRLNVSEDYLAYADAAELDCFIDFSWMKNAFVADFLAESLASAGYNRGTLSSYDGFVRNLDDASGSVYALALYDWRDEIVYQAAVMEYQGPMSIVTMRDYPLNSQDAWRFYQLSSGEIRTMYLDGADGLCKSALHDLTCYSPSASCAELALAMSPIFIADTLEREDLTALAGQDIWSVWCEDCVVCHTDPALALSGLYEQDGVSYAALLVG